MTEAQVFDKQLRIYSTSGFSELYGGLECAMYSKMMNDLFLKFPYDMFVWEYSEGITTIRLSGYNYITDELDEYSVIYQFESLPIKRFWFKVDNYPEKFVGTFLFPEEY